MGPIAILISKLQKILLLGVDKELHLLCTDLTFPIRPFQRCKDRWKKAQAKPSTVRARVPCLTGVSRSSLMKHRA